MFKVNENSASFSIGALQSMYLGTWYNKQWSNTGCQTSGADNYTSIYSKLERAKQYPRPYKKDLFPICILFSIKSQPSDFFKKQELEKVKKSFI